MKFFRLIIAIAVALSSHAGVLAETPAEKSVTIPLDQIWAFRMPRTRDILELEPTKPEEASRSLWDAVIRSLCADISPNWPTKNQFARPSFAVAGIGVEALRKASAVLVDGERPQDVFAAADEISIVFLSYQCGYYVELLKVERQDTEFVIHYRLVMPVEKTLPAHVAIIPVGILPSGSYHVSTVREATGRQQLDGTYVSADPEPRYAQIEKDTGERFVSGSFKFDVTVPE